MVVNVLVSDLTTVKYVGSMELPSGARRDHRDDYTAHNPPQEPEPVVTVKLFQTVCVEEGEALLVFEQIYYFEARSWCLVSHAGWIL